MNRLDVIIKCTNKGIEVPENYKPMFYEVLKYYVKNKGGNIRLRLDSPTQKRSIGDKSQNKHLNGHITTISNALQRDFAQVKKYIKYRAIENGYPILTDGEGNPVFDMWENMQGISETECDKKECGILIEMCHIFAAQNNIELIEEN